MIIFGFWSSLKKTVKAVARVVTGIVTHPIRFVKALVRVVVRIAATVIGVGLGIFDFFFGFLTWPEKKMRLQIFILSKQAGPLIDPGDLTASIDYARKVLKDRFNVKLLPYSKNIVEVIKEPAPAAALDVRCDAAAVEDEIGEAGEFFASHLAGWNAIPISLNFPITVFVVQNIEDKQGCSLGPFTDYLTLDLEGVKSENTLVHEIGHVCNLVWHSGSKSNLMWENDDRGDKVNWLQKNLVRSSRHVMYW
ncbi:MAG TPA: hypothetical protein VF914_21780 [Chloroflexia bacterium]